MKRWSRWQFSIVALVLGAALLAAAHTVADPDLWGHVRFGQLILERGSIPRWDPFSYLTAGQPWINHEWLAEVAFAAAFELGGAGGLVALKALLSLSIVLWVYVLLLGRGLEPLRAGILVMCLVALVRIGIATVRPHVFTYLLFLTVVVILDAAERGRGRLLWWLAPVFALWANLHGGFLAGLGILAVWSVAVGSGPLVARWRDGESGSVALEPWGVAALIVGIAAVLLNPYGMELVGFLLRTATEARPEITEWRPLRIQSIPGAWYVFFGVLLAGALLRTERRRRPGAMAVLAVSALVPLLAIRHLPLFGLAGIVLGGEHFASAFGRSRAAKDPEPASGRGVRTVVAGAVLASGLALGVLALPRFGCIELEEEYYPIRSVALLEASGASGNLAVFFNWGEYAIWHLAPAFRVSMDGRRETVYPDSIYREHLAFVRGTGDWDAVLDEHPTDVALVEWEGPAYNLLGSKPGWELMTRDSVAGLFARDEWPGRRSLRAAIEAGVSVPEDRACFP